MQTGLDSVIISIDSPEAAEYARSARRRPTRIIENIRALVSFRNRTLSPLEVGLEFVATKSTVKHLPRMRALAGSIGANFLFVTNVLPYEESYSQEILYSSTADYGAGGSGYHWHPRLLLPPLDNQADSTEHVIGALQKGERLINSTIHSIVNRGRGYCRFVGEGSLAVSWNGEMSPCIALMHNYTCYVLGRKNQSRTQVGNIKDSSIRETGNKKSLLFRKRCSADFLHIL